MLGKGKGLWTREGREGGASKAGQNMFCSRTLHERPEWLMGAQETKLPPFTQSLNAPCAWTLLTRIDYSGIGCHRNRLSTSPGKEEEGVVFVKESQLKSANLT